MLSYRIKSDDGFMGNTHALSVVAVVLSLAVLLPKIFYNDILSTNNFIVLLVALILSVGAGLIPDLDNTSSSIISTLGPIGVLLSSIMRTVAEGIYSISHTNREPSQSDPHRGFWHTAFAGIAFGLIVIFLMKLNTPFIKLSKYSLSIVTIILFVFLTIAIELIITVFFKKKLRHKNPLILWIVGIVASLLLITLMPKQANYTWVGIMIMIGWIIHILGDTITTSGTPILWPLKHHGKRWWDYRLPPHIHADGETEHVIIFPLFLIVSVVDLIIIIMRGM